MNLRARDGFALGAFCLTAIVIALVQDRAAPAADAKRTLLLLAGSGALAIVVAKTSVARRSIDHPAWKCAFVFLALSALSALWGLPSGLLDLGIWIGAASLAWAVRARGLRTAVLVTRGSAIGIGLACSLLTLGSYARGLRGFALHGGQGNPNWLGLLLAVTLPLSIEAAWLSRRRDRAWFFAALFSASLQLPTLWLAHSRVAFVGAVIAIAYLAVAARIRVKAVLVTMVLGGLLAVLPSTLARASEGDAEATSLDSLRGRIVLIEVSAQAAVTALPFGVGLGRFGHAYLEAQGRTLSTLSPKEAAHRFLNATTAHDEWLQVVIESGPLAMLALVATFGLAIAGLHRARLLGGSAALIACAVGACGDSPLRQPAIVMIVALVVASIPGRRSVQKTSSVRRSLFAISLLVAGAFLLASSTRSWLGARLRTAATEADPSTRLALLLRSVRMDRGSGENALDLGLARLEAGDPDGALVELVRARRLLANLGTSIAIGNAEIAVDRPDLAEISYREALSFHPGSMRAHADLADALRRLGRYEEAERHALIALQLSPGDARLQALIDRIHREQMDAATQ